jgi:carbamoyl-phosphate synthase large subunit
VDQLLGICREESVRLLVPTIDPELPVLAEAAEAFRAVGTHVLVPAKEATAVAADKRLTNGFLKAHGIGTVEQWSPKQAADIPFGDGRSFVGKPAGGSAGHGVMLLDGASRSLDLPADYVVEEFAPGREHTVDVYVDRHGQCVCVTPRERLEVRAGEVSKGITREVPLLDAAVRHLVSSLGLKGCVVAVQAFWDPSDNQLRIIEVNARFGGGFPLTLEAGANFPEWLLREYIFGERLTPFNAWRRNLLMSRYDDAVYVQK